MLRRNGLMSKTSTTTNGTLDHCQVKHFPLVFGESDMGTRAIQQVCRAAMKLTQRGNSDRVKKPFGG
jgi:hypothetical protein